MRKLNNIFVWMGLFLSCFQSLLAQDQKYVEERVNILQNKILDLKIKRIMSRFSWSGYLDTAYNNYDSQNQKTLLGPADPLNRNTKLYKSNLRININGSLSKKLNAYFTLDGSWYHNRSLQRPQAVYEWQHSNDAGYRTRVLKAYFDYELSSDFVFSAGKLSTIEGPPTAFIVDAPHRLGTYPLLVYSLPFDGFALTWKIHNSFDLKDEFVSRTVIAPLLNGNALSPWDGEILGFHPDDDNRLVKSGFYYTQMFEFHSSRLSVAERLSVIVQLSHGVFPSLQNILVPWTDGSLLEFSLKNDDALTHKDATIHLEGKGLFWDWFSVYFQFKQNWNRAPTPIDIAVIRDNGDIDAIFAGGTCGGDCTNQKLPTNYNFFANPASKTDGSQILYGVKFKYLNHFLGGEIYNGSLGAQHVAFLLPQTTSFYNEVGTGQHLYYGHRIHGQPMSFRLGYSRFETEHELILPYMFIPSNRKVSHIYTSLKVTF